ncbi:hypothetical protein GCM10012275_58280 [Longimycelium tulufanense]|uniref:Uncharacterized protein n=1 Tax=Longimycelium tulufanense TaxID=907463 RepID=A0A8J3FY84_9PSEU|nr:hypothetical protein GCM10012275_58280 [Longimycelium tulufanense]
MPPTPPLATPIRLWLAPLLGPPVTPPQPPTVADHSRHAAPYAVAAVGYAVNPADVAAPTAMERGWQY